MFQGSIVALITPFKNNEVDEKALRELVEFHIAEGTDAIVPCGTTGESATLSHEEHCRVIEIVIDQAKKRIPVIAGAGSNSTKEAVFLTEHAKKSGADAVLSITPYYNKPTQEGLYQHFKTIAEQVDIPIVLYNVPGRTGVNMLPDTVIRLSKVKNIIGVKEASGSLDQAGAILQHTDESFDVISGEDSLTFPMMAMGAKGVISFVANVAPKKMAQMCHAVLDNDMLLGRKLHYELLDLCKGVFFETNPIPAKKAAYMMGLVENEIRLPLVEMTKENTQKLKSIMEKLNIKIVRD